MIPRSQEKELLDIETPPIDELRHSLRNIETTNRLFLNNWLIKHFVKQLTAREHEVRILDIGTGIADIPKFLVQKLNSPNRRVTATGIDINPSVVALARENIKNSPGISVLEITDIANERFTVAIMSLILHHLSPDEAVDMLRETFRKVRAGIIISDFIRSPFNYYLAKWSIAITSPSRFNLHDGPLSVLRSYSDDEITAILGKAGIKKFKIRNFLIRKIVAIYK